LAQHGIVRYGMSYVPMDETWFARFADLSGRAFLVYHVTNTRDKIGGWMSKWPSISGIICAGPAVQSAYRIVIWAEPSINILEGIWESVCTRAFAGGSVK